jgi:hypothetical protein
MTRRTLLAGMLALRIVRAAKPVTSVAKIDFYSDELVNLHHTLYAAAWARRPQSGTQRALGGALPAPLDAPMTVEERAVWERVIDYYDQHLADRDLLFGRGMDAIKESVARGELPEEVREPLSAAGPIYRRYFWTAHDRRNREWLAATSSKMQSIAADVIPKLEKFYGMAWFSSPVRADIVWVGNRQGGYTTTRPPHATIASGDPASVDWAAVEIVFHEFSHVLIERIDHALGKSLGDRARQHNQLWHVVQFYLTGTAVQQVLKSRGIAYTPYLFATGLIDRAWPQYKKPVEANWAPYVEGKADLDTAIAGTVKMLLP